MNYLITEETLLLQKRAGIITESQYKDYLLILEDETINENLKAWLLSGAIALASLTGVGKVYQMNKAQEKNEAAQKEYFEKVLDPGIQKMEKKNTYGTSQLGDLGAAISAKTKDVNLATIDPDPKNVDNIFSNYALKYMKERPNEFAVGMNGEIYWKMDPTALKD